MATPGVVQLLLAKEGIEVNLQSYEYGETALMILEWIDKALIASR